MADLLKSNPMALRHCILFEVLQGTSIKEAYSKFCRTIGNDFMEYREFDFWYYRFLNGDYDSNFERDKDKKIYELSDMPIVVMEKIVGKLGILDRISLAKTSRSFQTFVENQKLLHHTLKLNASNSTTNVSFGTLVDIQYKRNDVGCEIRFEKRETLVRGVQQWKRAFLDVKSILKNPKLYLDTFEIVLFSFESLEYVLNCLEDALKFTHHLNVKNVFFVEYSWNLMTKVLPTLKPGCLTTIDILSYTRNAGSMNSVFEMEQWKQAKRFVMSGTRFIWSLHHLFHFTEFQVWLLELTVEDIRQMKEILFKSPSFESCFLNLHFLPDYIDMFIFEQEFGNPLRENPSIYHYPIPNSNEYFEIKVERHNFEITKKKR